MDDIVAAMGDVPGFAKGVGLKACCVTCQQVYLIPRWLVRK